MDGRKRLMTTEETAQMLSVSKSFLEQDRHREGSAKIPFVKLGKAVRYRLSDVETFIEGLELRASTPRAKRPRNASNAA